MKIDVSRDTYRPWRHFTRVLMQQGRVQLDSDANEQAEIVLHYLRRIAADWGGLGWGPGNSFRVELGEKDADGDYPLYLDPGYYYVAGILCADEPPPLPWAAYTGPPPPAKAPWPRAFVGPAGVKGVKADGKAGHVQDSSAFAKATALLVVLRVRERLVTALEDPHLLEVALGGRDTAARTQIRFEPHVVPAPERVTAEAALYYKVAYEAFRAVLDPDAAARERAPGRLAARAHAPDAADPCVLSSGSAYRGLENQLFRVEISTGGDFTKARFVSAPDNASLVARYTVLDKTKVTLEGTPALEGQSGFARGDYVELTDDEHEAAGKNGTFFKVTNVAGHVLTLDTTQKDIPTPHRHPKARRWSAPGEVLVAPPDNSGKSDGWIPIGSGVEVKFDPKGNYRVGDYWLIPARTRTGGVDWPTEEVVRQPAAGAKQQQQQQPPERHPRLLPPRRLAADEAPLAFLDKPAAGKDAPRPRLIDLRRSAPAPVLSGPPAPPALLDAFRALIVSDASPVLRLFAVGIAAYRFDGKAEAGKKWQLATLAADLLEEGGAIVGRHTYPGPDATKPRLVWEAADGSRFEADPANTTSAPSVPAGQLTWTLDTASNPTAFGLFNKVARVQRLFVVSTPVPADNEVPPDGTETRAVNFLATYYFYTQPAPR
jgi:hypothetical protein